MGTAAPPPTDVAKTATSAAEWLFAGPGEMCERCRAFDWASTPLGPIDSWPQSLRTAVQMVLAAPFPNVVLWGPDLVQIYNDGCRALMGMKHPAGLGQPTRECWPEVWHINAPIYERVRGGESLAFEDALYPVTRSGVLEDAWFTLSYSPIRNESGAVGGVLVTVFETTAPHRGATALRASAEQYRAIVEGARDYAIFTADVEGRIESWSPGAEAVFGWTAAEAAGQPIEITFVPEDRAAGEPARELRTARERGVAPDVRWHLRKDDGRVFIEGTTRALRDDAGRLHRFLKVGQDVTRRRALDESLRASEARYRVLVENVLDYAIFLLDADGVVTEWTPGAERVKGYSADEVVGRHVSLFYTPEDVAAGEPARELTEAAETGRAEREAWRVRKGGARFWAGEIATAVRDRDGRLVGFTKIARDLTERRMAEDAAERSRAAAERDVLRRRLALAEEEERRRLSRELHDEASQHLTALGLGLQALADVAPAGSEVDRRVAALRVVVDLLGQELHAVALRLRPKALDDFGLEAALATYAEEWSRRTGIAVSFHSGVEARLPEAVESAIYRIAQEALTNVAKHSGATHASLVAERHGGNVYVIVEDNGRGFDTAVLGHPGGAPASAGLGLIGAHERAVLLGGSVEVESAPGAGTTLYVRIPVEADDRQRSGDGDRATRSEVAHE